MNRCAFLSFLCFFLLSCAFPQTKQEFANADDLAKSAPDSVESSISSLSDYFLEYLASEKELIRAFYFWTSNEIEYDIENMFNFSSSDNPKTIITETLHKRKAVCQGYAEVFHELCEMAGIESFVVFGYTKQNGHVVLINHAWAVARIDTNWYFFDPTWGSGAVINGKFTRKFTDEYFLVKPVNFIKSHMPFDPLWQCLYNPISPDNFAQGRSPGKASGNYFNYLDSIDVYKQSTTQEKLIGSLRRIQQNGGTNKALIEYQDYLRTNLEIVRYNKQNEIQKEQVDKFNLAVHHYNTGTRLLNDYIAYWNRQFKPIRSDAEIRRMVDTCDYQLTRSRQILAEVQPQEEALRKNMDMLSTNVQEIQKRVDEQKNFLREYFATSKSLRASLFRK